MEEQSFNEMFGKRLLKYLELRNKNQADLAKALNVSKTSVSNWCKGLKTPRMDKVDMICDYLLIKRSDLINSDIILESHSPKEQHFNRLLTYMEMLNGTGIKKLEEYAKDLSYNTLYSKNTEELLAAHERTDVNKTNENQKRDLEIMDNDDNWK